MTEDEQKFWDAVFSAVISGVLTADPRSRTTGEVATFEAVCAEAGKYADAALAQRRARQEKD